MTRPRFAPRYKFDHSAEQRDCALYYIDVLDHDTGQVVLNDYIGETGRESFTRFMEHLYDQPFGDRIVGTPRVDPRRFAGKDAVLAAEREAVERLKPRLNYEWNLGNKDRIPVWKQRAQRAERDAAKGVVSRWTLDGKPNPAFGNQQQVAVRSRAKAAESTRVKPSPAIRRRRNAVLGWAALWAVLFGFAWITLAVFAHRWQVEAPGRVWPVLAAGLATAPLLGGLRTKRRRKVAWIVLAAVTVILMGLAAK